MHGTLARADTFNNIAAMGPDFKSGYVDGVPMSNADLAPTLASLMGINLPFQGTLSGRILREAIKGSADVPSFTTDRKVSGVSNGVMTVMLTQQVGDERYYDEACLVSAAASPLANPCR